MLGPIVDDVAKTVSEFMKEYKADINEAEYQGRTVKLGKPMRGDVIRWEVELAVDYS